VDFLWDDREVKSLFSPPFLPALCASVRAAHRGDSMETNTLSGQDEFDELFRVVWDAYPGVQSGTPALEHDDTINLNPPQPGALFASSSRDAFP